MGNILVIEPRKLLQHATAIALFPEHEARIMENVPPAAQVKEFDAVVIDAAALREASGLTEQTLVAMEAWSTPVVWVDGDPPRAPNRDKLVILKRPVSRDAMRAALAECLGQGLRPQVGGSALLDQGVPTDAKPAGRRVSTTPMREPKFIELVDVVDESPADRPGRGEKKKKK